MRIKQAKIRKILFIALVSILGLLIILYVAFCRGGDYNKVEINFNQPEQTTLQDVSQDETPETPDEPEDDATENPEKPARKQGEVFVFRPANS